MVDPEDLFFIKGFFQFLVELTSCFQVCTERFFNDQALKALPIHNSFGFEVFGNGSKKLRSHGQEEDLVVFCLVFFIQAILQFTQGDVMFGIIDIMTLVVEMTGEFLGLLRAIGQICNGFYYD